MLEIDSLLLATHEFELNDLEKVSRVQEWLVVNVLANRLLVLRPLGKHILLKCLSIFNEPNLKCIAAADRIFTRSVDQVRLNDVLETDGAGDLELRRVARALFNENQEVFVRKQTHIFEWVISLLAILHNLLDKRPTACLTHFSRNHPLQNWNLALRRVLLSLTNLHRLKLIPLPDLDDLFPFLPSLSLIVLPMLLKAVFSICLREQVLEQLNQDDLLLPLFELLLQLHVHFVEGSYPLVDHKPAQNERMNRVFNLGEGLASNNLLLAAGHLVFVQRSKLLEVCLQLEGYVEGLGSAGVRWLVVLENVEGV